MNLDRLLDVWEKLGERERQVLVTLGQRLYVGQKRHGKLSIDKKDWTYEAIEEALDGSIYLTCALSDRVDKAFNNAVADAEAEVIESKGVVIEPPMQTGLAYYNVGAPKEVPLAPIPEHVTTAGPTFGDKPDYGPVG